MFENIIAPEFLKDMYVLVFVIKIEKSVIFTIIVFIIFI